MPDKIYIYGDSLLKATVPDGDFHYHFHINEVMQRYQTKLVEVVNRSKMGATIRKGLSLVRHDLDRGLEARYALVSYGGNDSDFDWAAIDADPEADHRPNTELPEFADTLHETLDVFCSRPSASRAAFTCTNTRSAAARRRWARCRSECARSRTRLYVLFVLLYSRV